MSTGPSRRIVVDDSDAQILYSSDFFVDDTGSQDSQGNFGTTLKSTLHGTKSSGSFQFQFSGTEIRVYGTVNQNTHAGHIDPSWECFIDNISIGQTNPFQFVENNWSLCASDTLADTSHILTVNVNSHGRTFWFDYLQYTPSANVPLDNTLIYVDRMDSAVKYDPSWRPLGNIANMTSVPGSKMMLDFIGTSLQWYSLIPTELPHAPALATYSIDGAPEVSFALQGLGSPTAVSEHNRMIFQTPALASGSHTITVIFNGSSSTTPLTLEYILVQNGTNSLPSENSSIAVPSASTLSLPSTSAPLLPSASAPLVNYEGDLGRPNVGSIVGGVLGSLFFLLSIVAAYLLYKRYKQDRANDPKVRNTIPIPFYPRPRNPRPPSPNNSFSSVGTLNELNNDPLSQPIILTQPPSHRRRHSQRQAQLGSSYNPALPDSIEEANENTSYYGGYQTWGQAKALEAKSRSQRPRDSYM